MFEFFKAERLFARFFKKTVTEGEQIDDPLFEHSNRAFEHMDKAFQEMDKEFDAQRAFLERSQVKRGETKETVTEEKKPDGTVIVTRTTIHRGG